MVSPIKNNKGFTLLEIIVVMIIVGVLAAIALPNLFSNVERQRAQEALTTIGVIKNGMESCLLSGALASTCTTTSIGYTAASGALFGYAVSGQTGSVSSASDTAGYVITATRNTLSGGDGNSTIILTRSNGAFTKGTGGTNNKFAGVW